MTTTPDKHIDNISDIMEAFRPLFDKAYAKEKITPKDYKGPEITSNAILVIDFNVKDSLTKGMLESHADQGRDVITVLMTKLFQLGFQNGMAQHFNDTKHWRDIAEILKSQGKKE